MKKRTSRLLSSRLVLCMVLALLPGTALADGTTVYAGNTAELKAALKSNTTIILEEGKDYTVSDFFYLSNLENVTIRGGAGTRLMSTSEESVVVYLMDCKNVTLDNLIIGHDIPATEWGCEEGVVYAYGTKSLTITNCELFGCGLVGIGSWASTIEVKNSTIRDCSAYILEIGYNSSMVFNQCTFSGNGYSNPNPYAINMYQSKLELHNCTFRDNKNPRFASGSPVLDKCAFINNSWSDPPSTSPTPDTPDPFTDVPADAYYAKPVGWAVANGITNGNGDGTFAPESDCTRAQIVTFLWRAYGEQKPSSTVNPFTDVKKGAYYYDAVLWAAEKGITNGNGDGTFGVEGNCNRAQAVTFLWRAAGKPAAGSGNSFGDVDNSAYYADAVKWAVANSITNGSGNGFSPDGVCTRAQIVTFLYRNLAEN